MDQTHHAERNRDRDTRAHQGPLPRGQHHVFGAVEVYPRVAIVSAAGQRKPGVKTHNGETVRHGATDYS
ncbi:hypothetical protein MPSD_20390 [Mycobacterium pseudoshottsii JCM 15466]|uniref:Uncharacterized protein n=1 Tax=Mycobacterium pseudoshottsii TaxID=265949 RepID=A0A9N7LLM8_9MYCO|nr:hypothetical protein MPSD_20390 [Mycobacterium pseudoshottsii JCM 15466]BDN81795.1 hypothetical protein NJB1907Z4_C20100 [Mycobacterium pseudoshottsii]